MLLLGRYDQQKVIHQHITSQDTPIILPPFTPSCQKVQEWWDAPNKIKMLVGGNQSGKSTTAGAYVADYVRNHPGCLVWAVAPNFEMTKICFDKLDEYFHPDEICEPIWAAKGKGIAYSQPHKNGGRVVFKSEEAGFRKFEAAQCDLVWIDEQLKSKMVFTSCVARTTMTGGQILLSFTPLLGKTHWSYKDLFLNDNVFSRTISLYDNIYLDPKARDMQVAFYGEEELPYRVYGEWGILEGRIYKTFNEDVHVIPFDIELFGRIQYIIRGVDFGRWKACSWVGIDHDEDAYILAEWKNDECSIQDMAEAIISIEEEFGYAFSHKIIDTHTDHAFQERFELEAHGIPCTPANKSVQLGIEIFRRRLKVHENGRPSLFVCDNCPKTIEEIESYVSKPGTQEPKKPQNDHLIDGTRYALVELDTYCEGKFGELPRIQSAGKSMFI